MADQKQFRRGTTAYHASFTGAAGEITVDTDKNVPVVHDGSTPGGYPCIGESARAFRAYLSSDQSISAATFTVVQFDTTAIDSNSWFNTSTYKFTPLLAGKWLFGTTASFQVTAAGERKIIDLQKNGATDNRLIDFATATGVADSNNSGSAITTANGTTDYFEISVYSSASDTVRSGATQTIFWGVWCGS